MRTPLAGLLAVVALLAAAPAASAVITSTYDGASDTLTVTSDGSGDTIVVTCPAANLLINGATPPSGALPCSGSVGTLVLIGNGGGDTLDVSGISALPIGTVTVDGGEGDDDLRGVPLTSNGYVVTLLGGGGNDLLTSNSSDVARGGSGDDRIDGFVQDGGTLEGDQGTDTFGFALPLSPPASFAFTPRDGGLTISVSGGTDSQILPWASIEVVDLLLNDGAQTVDGSAFSGSLRVRAEGGADTITGTAAADVLNGGAGNDFLDGGAGADVYQAGAGLDLLHARDGTADTGDCGSEEDTLVADAIDAIGGCERIDLPVAPVSLDKTKPALGLKRATLRKRKLRLPVSCPKSEVRCAGLIKIAGVGKRKGATVSLKLGTITFQLAGGKSKTLTRTLSRKQRRALGKLKRARLRVTLDVVDASGNRAKGVRRIGLKR